MRIPATARSSARLAGCLALLAGVALAQDEPFPRSMRAFEPVPIWFPPIPPPIDRVVGRPPVSGGPMRAPAELAPCVSELFYAPLSTRLALHELSAKLRRGLDDYLAARRTLLVELRAELARVRDFEPPARESALQAFARIQTPKLTQLENTADELRQQFMVGDQGWNDLREWHLTDRERRGFSPLEIAQVMRGYAYYQAGLLPAQRRLLREIAVELAMAADTTAKATAALPHVFFQPELARVTFPDDLPPPVAAKVAAFQTKKALLKKELYDTVHDFDGVTLAFLRNPFRALAEKQAPHLAELETLADEIRRGLSALPAAGPRAERSPLPVALVGRTTALLHDRDAAQREATTKVEAVTEHATDLVVRYRFDDDGLKFIATSRRAIRSGKLSPEEAARVDQVTAELSAIADTYGRRLAELINERDAIRRDAGEILGTQKTDVIDAALVTANRIVAQRDAEGAYAEYRAAIFTVGLSPPQRRLLFNGAIERLDLPLPRGEIQPVQRANSW
jgi:hypothetical protein